MSRELGDAGTSARQAINDDMIDISKYFPRDTSSRDRLHLPHPSLSFPRLDISRSALVIGNDIYSNVISRL